MDREIRLYAGDVELRAKGDTVTIAGYAAVFNKDSEPLGGFIEQVAPSAFNKTLKEADIRGLFNHDSNYVLGRNKAKTMKLGTDATGLHYEIDANLDDPDHVRVIQKIERGDITGSSFGFRTVKDKWDDVDPDDGELPKRTLIEVKLFDVGPVTFPAYPDTEAQLSSRALASFAEAFEVPLEQVLAAAGANELRSLIRTLDTPTPDLSTSTPSLAAYRNRLELARHRTPVRV